MIMSKPASMFALRQLSSLFREIMQYFSKILKNLKGKKLRLLGILIVDVIVSLIEVRVDVSAVITVIIDISL